MRRFLLCLTLVSVIIWLSINAYATDVIINEVSIDRSPQAVELFNKASDSADISGWFIDDSGGTSYYTVPKDTVIYPNSCIVVEGDFNLNKSSADIVRLFTSFAAPTATNAALIDSYSYKTGPGINYTFSRDPDGTGNWLPAATTLGSWNTSGTNCIITPTATPTLSPTIPPSPSPIPTEPSNPTATPYPSFGNIIISEAYPYPETGEKEWVELYNGNTFEVGLNKWYLDDIESGGGTPRQFSITIPALQYAVIELQSPLYNNDSDSVRLLDNNKREVDGLEYDKAEKGRSFARIAPDGERFCLTEPSKGQPNKQCQKDTTTTDAAAVSSVALSSGPTLTPIPHSVAKTAGAIASPTFFQHGEILGETTTYPTITLPNTSLPIRHFAPVSFSYAILTIVSLLIKIRNGLQA